MPPRPSQAAAAKRLDELPEELISHIAVKLHADDIAAFRLTSRALEQKSFHEFATEYFSEKCFMFTTDSLKVLVGISASARLCGYLQHVHFMTAVFSKGALGCPSGCNCAWQPSVKQSEAYRGYVHDQKTLADTGRDKQMLMTAFANLTNLSSLSIDDAQNLLGPDVDYRGNNKVFRLTGRLPMAAGSAATSVKDSKEYQAYFRHVWQVVMQAAEKLSSLKHFRTILNNPSQGLPVAFLDVKNFSKSGAALNGLQTLLLRVRSSSGTNYTYEAPPSARDLKILTKFAEALTSLENLNLNFDNADATGPHLVAFTNGLDLSKITNFQVDAVYVAVTKLATIVTRLRCVKDLRFTFINLTKGTWVTILKLLQGMTSHLKHLHLMYLLEAGQKAYFLKQIDRGFLDPYSHDDGGFGDDDFSDEPDTDDDLPALEPADGLMPDTLHPPMASGSDADIEPANLGSPTLATPTPGPSSASTVLNHSTFDHVQPGILDTGERGYFVCVQGDEIAAQLPTFIKEYNLGEDVNDDPLAGGLPAGVPANILNLFGAALGAQGPPPPPGPPGPAPPPGAAGHGVGGGGNTGTFGGHAGHTGGAHGGGGGGGGGTSTFGGHIGHPGGANGGFAVPFGNASYAAFPIPIYQPAGPVPPPPPPPGANATSAGNTVVNGAAGPGPGPTAAAGPSTQASTAAGWMDADSDVWEDEEEDSEEEGSLD